MMSQERKSTEADLAEKLADRMAFYKLNQMQLYIEHTFLFRDFSEIWRDDTPLTAEEILELDRYCLERGIELVPSLSTFGHLYKVLGSKHYSHLCELEGSEAMPFSLRGRMHHHTINVSSPESAGFIKGKDPGICSPVLLRTIQHLCR